MTRIEEIKSEIESLKKELYILTRRPTRQRNWSIFERVNSGMSRKDVAAIYGITPNRVGQIVGNIERYFRHPARKNMPINETGYVDR